MSSDHHALLAVLRSLHLASSLLCPDHHPISPSATSPGLPAAHDNRPDARANDAKQMRTPNIRFRNPTSIETISTLISRRNRSHSPTPRFLGDLARHAEGLNPGDSPSPDCFCLQQQQPLPCSLSGIYMTAAMLHSTCIVPCGCYPEKLLRSHSRVPILTPLIYPATACLVGATRPRRCAS